MMPPSKLWLELFAAALGGVASSDTSCAEMVEDALEIADLATKVVEQRFEHFKPQPRLPPDVPIDYDLGDADKESFTDD